MTTGWYDEEAGTRRHNEKYDRLIEEMGGLGVLVPLLPADLETIRKKLKEDKNLNNIRLPKWDKAAGRIDLNEVHQDYRTSPDGPWLPGLSLLDRVCILKRAAERLAIGVEYLDGMGGRNEKK